MLLLLAEVKKWLLSNTEDNKAPLSSSSLMGYICPGIKKLDGRVCRPEMQKDVSM